MDIQFLFSSFPFLSENGMTLSQLYVTDEEYLQEILELNGFTHSSAGHILSAEQLFASRRSIELGYYKNDQPNLLLGTVTITDINPELESVRLEIMPKYDEPDAAVNAVKTVLDFLFDQIKVNRVHVRKDSLQKAWLDIFMANGFLLEGIIRQTLIDPITKEKRNMSVLAKLYSEHIKKKGEATDEIIVAFDD